MPLFESWICDCKRSASAQNPARHFAQYDSELRALPVIWPYRVMVLPGRGDIKQAKGETQVGEGDEVREPVECPTWRRAVRDIPPRVRSWKKYGIDEEISVEDEDREFSEPAGPTSPVEEISAAELPPRHSGRALARPGVRVFRVSGRMVPDGPVVTRYRLVGDGWHGDWTGTSFAVAVVRGVRTALLRDLRAALAHEG